MTFRDIEVRPVTPIIGAEIGGIDLSRPLTNRQTREIHDALMAHQVLFFRDQEVTLDQLKGFGRLFGDLHLHPHAKSPDAHPEILRIHADENSVQIAGDRWHSDVSCDAEPPMGSVLHLHTVPPVGGDTLFASMYAAYDALSDRMKACLEGMTAIHDGGPAYRERDRRVGADESRVYPRAEHPVIRTHPVTGRKAIFVNPVFTVEIVGVPKVESEGLLRLLHEHNAQPHWQCRFRWQKNSVAFWDNRCTQHIAMWDYYPQVRSGHRVTIGGDRPI